MRYHPLLFWAYIHCFCSHVSLLNILRYITIFFHSTDLYLNYTLVGLAEIPACILCVLLMDRWGRRLVFGGCQVLAGSACLAAALVTGSEADFLQVRLTYFNM